MPITYTGAHRGDKFGTTGGTTTAIDTTGSSLIVVHIAYFGNPANLTFTDSASNTWNTVTPANYNSNGQVYLTTLYAKNPTTSSSHTFSPTVTSASGVNITVQCFAGTDITSPEDLRTGKGDVFQSSIQATSGITPSANNYLVVSAGVMADTGMTVNSGMTETDDLTSTTGGRGLAAAYIIQTTATAINPTWTSSSATYNVTSTTSFKVGPTAPAVTTVDSDQIVNDGQTGVSVVGTDMGATNSDRTFTLRQGSTSVAQTETGTGTSTAAALTIAVDQSGADIKFGAATLRCTRTSDSLYGDMAITVLPPSGQLYVDIVTPDATAGNRITATADIASGDQLQARGVGGGSVPTGLVIQDDGTFYFTSGNTPAAFDVRVWSTADSTWGAWATQSMGSKAFPFARRMARMSSYFR